MHSAEKVLLASTSLKFCHVTHQISYYYYYYYYYCIQQKAVSSVCFNLQTHITPWYLVSEFKTVLKLWGSNGNEIQECNSEFCIFHYHICPFQPSVRYAYRFLWKSHRKHFKCSGKYLCLAVTTLVRVLKCYIKFTKLCWSCSRMCV